VQDCFLAGVRFVISIDSEPQRHAFWKAISGVKLLRRTQGAAHSFSPDDTRSSLSLVFPSAYFNLLLSL
jgi:hypothetical protein